MKFIQCPTHYISPQLGVWDRGPNHAIVAYLKSKEGSIFIKGTVWTPINIYKQTCKHLVRSRLYISMHLLIFGPTPNTINANGYFKT